NDGDSRPAIDGVPRPKTPPRSAERLRCGHGSALPRTAALCTDRTDTLRDIEGRGSRIEDRIEYHCSILDLPSSILDLPSSILDPHSWRSVSIGSSFVARLAGM